MSNKPGFFRQLKDTQNYSTKFLIVLFSPNSGVTPNWSVSQFRAERVKAERALLAFWVRMSESEQKTQSEQKGRKVQNVNY